jgi:hypothetical protein
MKNIIFVTAAAAALMLSVPLAAQVGENAPASEPADQNQTPGLQQAPDGQTMKTAVEKEKSTKESQSAPNSEGTSTSTGPTFPNDKTAK